MKVTWFHSWRSIETLQHILRRSSAFRPSLARSRMEINSWLVNNCVKIECSLASFHTLSKQRSGWSELLCSLQFLSCLAFLLFAFSSRFCRFPFDTLLVDSTFHPSCPREAFSCGGFALNKVGRPAWEFMEQLWLLLCDLNSARLQKLHCVWEPCAETLNSWPWRDPHGHHYGSLLCWDSPLM